MLLWGSWQFVAVADGCVFAWGRPRFPPKSLVLRNAAVVAHVILATINKQPGSGSIFDGVPYPDS